MENKINGLTNEHYIELSEKDYKNLKAFLAQKSKQLSLPTRLMPSDFIYGINYTEEEGIRDYHLIIYQKKDKLKVQEMWKNEFLINGETTKIIVRAKEELKTTEKEKLEKEKYDKIITIDEIEKEKEEKDKK